MFNEEESAGGLHGQRGDDQAAAARAETLATQHRGTRRGDRASQAFPEGGRTALRLPGTLRHGRVGRLAGSGRPRTAHRSGQVGRRVPHSTPRRQHPG